MSEATPAAILQIGTGFMASKTLLSAIELGVFNTLAKGPADLATLQQKLGLHPRSARDFLDALVSLKLLERNNHVYSNTVETDLFLDKAKASYVGGLLEMANARLYRFWGSLTEALKTGELQNEGKGGGDNFFAAMYATPDKLRDFLRAMSGLSVGPALAIAEKFDWEALRDLHGPRDGAGRVASHCGRGPSASHRHRLRPPPCSTRVRGLCRRPRALRQARL